MGNIISYLKWRGDLRFQDQPFCEADSLALALLSYADLDGSIPSIETDENVTIENAYVQYCQREHPDDFNTRSAEALLREMATSQRFRNARLSRFQCVLDAGISTQFAALQIELEDGTFYGGVDSFGIILLSIINSENRTKLVVLKFVKAFFQNLASIDFKEALLNKAVYKGIALFLLGLFCIMAPDFTLRAVGTCAGAALFLWSLQKLYRLTVAGAEDLPKRKQRFVLYVFLMCLAEFYITSQQAVLISTHLLIAAILLVFAYRQFCAAMTENRPSFFRFGKVFASVIAMMLGVVAAVITDGKEGIYVLSLGSFILLYGTASIANALYQNGKQNNS